MKPMIGLFLFAWVLQAQPVHLEFEPDATKVEYTVDSTLHTVHGTFALKSGEIDYDTATGDAHGAVVIDALSGESGSEARDKRMHKAVLESAKFAEIKFVPDHVEGAKPSGAADSDLKLHGQFLLHGEAHEMEIAAKVHEENGLLKISSAFQVPYVDWGLKNPSMFVLRVAKSVNIHIEADARMMAN